MGFLKFLKRDKSKELDFGLDDLDMPPAPPGMDGKRFEDFPDIPEMPELPDMDEPIPDMMEKKKPVSEIKIPPLQQTMGMREPVLPQPERFEPLEDTGMDYGMKNPEPMAAVEEEVPEFKPKPRMAASPYERFERAAVREERGVLERKDAKGPVFMRVDKFRNVLRDISEIRVGLKDSNEIISKLSQIDANTEKEFEKWKNVMADMQKKLVFADKILFKGDGK